MGSENMVRLFYHRGEPQKEPGVQPHPSIAEEVQLPKDKTIKALKDLYGIVHNVELRVDDSKLTDDSTLVELSQARYTLVLTPKVKKKPLDVNRVASIIATMGNQLSDELKGKTLTDEEKKDIADKLKVAPEVQDMLKELFALKEVKNVVGPTSPATF
jgi:hypothetical protein